MGIIRQIGFEVRNILKSKFILIIAIIILLAGVAIPVISLLNNRKIVDGGVEPPIVIYDATRYAASYSSTRRDIGLLPKPVEPGQGESITIDGITVYSDNPYFWNLRSLLDEQVRLSTDKNPFSTPAALDLTLELIDEEILYYPLCDSKKSKKPPSPF